MKRIIFLIFFSLALVAIPFAAFASDTEATSTEEVLIEAYSAEYYPTPTPTPTPHPRPPVFVNFNPPTSATSTVEYSYDADAEDPDLDPICFCLAFSPSGMNIST